MAEEQLRTLRDFELRLLRCTLSPPLSTSKSSDKQTHCPSSICAHINNLLNSIQSGDYLQALSSEPARLVFLSPGSDLVDSSECAGQFYSELLVRVEAFIVNDAESNFDKACRVVLVMCIAIASLFWFTQSNMTGPLEADYPMKSSLPLNIPEAEGRELVEWENWACNQLMSAGSDLLGKFSYIQYMVFAKLLLMKTKDLLFEASLSTVYGVQSISWWITRTLLIHQRILDERSSSLFNLLQVFMGETLHYFGTLENITNYWGTQLHDMKPSDIVAMVHLEAGVLEYIYGRVDSCRRHFDSAEVAADLQLSVTGALGFRTLYQVEPKAQMVLVANTSSSNNGDACPSMNHDIQKNHSSDADVFMTPKLLESGYSSETGTQCIQNGNSATHLKAIQQAVILSQCLVIEESSRHDEMQRWDMAPYIEAIDSQQSSYFILKCFCDILRIRWEATRSRTKGRALETMDKVVERVSKSSPAITQRIPLCYVVYIPTIPALRKEYAELLVSCGLIGEALKIFEDLELWDNLIHCNCLLGKKAAAVELIKARLSEMPNDPRLWCSLGDVTNSDACYEKALEVSNDKSARAKRSLARSAYNRGDYEISKNLWESVMALNSLYPDGWFALGAAALKARDIEKALDGFTRAVQLDPENGEAWNNIACLHMIKKRSREAFIAFKEALKFKRNSWQLWENFSQVAFDVGNLGQALEAVQMVLKMTNNKRIDVELLERIMRDLEGKTKLGQCESAAASINNDYANQGYNAEEPVESVGESAYQESTIERPRETEHLVELLGKVLQQIVRSESRGDVWGLYARWHKIKGDMAMCCEALLKQVRSYQGSELWKDRHRFKRFAQASLELCEAYMSIASSTGSRIELIAAEMHLKNILRQAGAFADMENYRDLQACLDRVTTELLSHV